MASSSAQSRNWFLSRIKCQQPFFFFLTLWTDLPTRCGNWGLKWKSYTCHLPASVSPACIRCKTLNRGAPVYNSLHKKLTFVLGAMLSQLVCMSWGRELQFLTGTQQHQIEPPAETYRQGETGAALRWLAWRVSWTEKPGRLQSTGLQRVRHNWATNTQHMIKSVTLSLECRFQKGEKSRMTCSLLYSQYLEQGLPHSGQ